MKALPLTGAHLAVAVDVSEHPCDLLSCLVGLSLLPHLVSPKFKVWSGVAVAVESGRAPCPSLVTDTLAHGLQSAQVDDDRREVFADERRSVVAKSRLAGA